MGEGQMPRVSDRDRVLRLLSETEGLSNNRIKTELDLPDERYAAVRDMLLDDSLIEKYQCYGGGIRLTRKQTQGLQSGRSMGKLVFAAEESFQGHCRQGPGRDGILCRPELVKMASKDAEISDAETPVRPLVALSGPTRWALRGQQLTPSGPPGKGKESSTSRAWVASC
jgi:hypothetical protein